MQTVKWRYKNQKRFQTTKNAKNAKANQNIYKANGFIVKFVPFVVIILCDRREVNFVLANYINDQT